MIKLLIFLMLICFPFVAIAQDTDRLICKDEDRTVRVEFEGNAKCLELNKPTKLKIYVENIDLKKSAISGRGIRPLGNSRKGEFFLGSVTVDEEGVVDGNFEMRFSYLFAEDDYRVCTFLIPVKR